jgi:hypothetical protein
MGQATGILLRERIIQLKQEHYTLEKISEELSRLQVPFWAKNYIAPCKSLTISNLQGIF